MEVNDLTSLIIKAAIEVHRQMGPGLLESVYQRCLAAELQDMGIQFRFEVPVSIAYKGRKIHDEGFRMDLLVEDTVVVELKAKEAVTDTDKKQVLTYLRLADKRVGLLINFNEAVLKNGITRIVNRLPEPALDFATRPTPSSASSAPLRETVARGTAP